MREERACHLPQPSAGGGKTAACAIAFLLQSKAGGGGARSATEGAAAERQAHEALADDRFRIGGPACDCEEATIHVERCARAWAAVGSGRCEDDLLVVEVERLACEKLRYALRDHLVAEPFGLAEVFPAVAPVGFEAVALADALEARHVAEDRGEPRHKCMDRPGPAWGLALCRCVVGFSDCHGRDYTAPFSPADPVPLFPPNFSGKWLRLREKISEFPPNRDNGYPPNSAPFPSLQAAPSGPSGHLPRTSCEGGRRATRGSPPSLAKQVGEVAAKRDGGGCRSGGIRSVPSERSTEVLGSPGSSPGLRLARE